MYLSTFSGSNFTMEVFKISELNYFNPYEDDRFISSVDNLVLHYRLIYRSGQKVLDELSRNCPYSFKHWSSSKLGSCRENFNFKSIDGFGFWLGVGMNSPSGLKEVAVLDFNPNKCGTLKELDYIRSMLTAYTKDVDCKRYDLAVDYPIPKRCVSLVKDHRTYEMTTNSKYPETEYLGQRSTVGRIKLYDKTKESKLSYDCSRLELTLSPMPYEDFLKVFPTAYFVDDIQLQLNDVGKLNETENYILEKILQTPSDINRLGRKMRKKIEDILNKYTSKLDLPRQAYDFIISQIYDYCKPYACKFKHFTTKAELIPLSPAALLWSEEVLQGV